MPIGLYQRHPEEVGTRSLVLCGFGFVLVFVPCLHLLFFQSSAWLPTVILLGFSLDPTQAMAYEAQILYISYA